MLFRSKNNDWSREHNVTDKFVVLYSGTLGLKHNPSLLTNLAKRFSHQDDFLLLVVSEGLGADWIQKEIITQKISNLLLLPFQPFTDLPKLLGSADILLTILEPEAGVFSVPSKVLTNFCSSRAQVLSCPENNLAARNLIEQNAGIVTKDRKSVV